MLKETLLLDSTRPFSDAPNMDIGCPEHSSEGVPSSWYALRVSYSRELKVQDRLNELGVKTFVPMMWRRCPVKPGMTTGNPGMTKGKPGMTTGNPGMTTGNPGMTTVNPGMTKGKPTTSSLPAPTGQSTESLKRMRKNPSRRLVPAVGNLCFAYSTRAELEDFIRGYGDTSPVHFYWDRTANKPLTVPEKAMNDFIAVSSTLDEDLIYITEITSKLREGQTVKVKEGPFKGVEGKVVRIRKSRRILVELPGMLAVATTYIQPEYLEII